MGPERDQLPLSRAALTAWRGSTPSKARLGVPPQVIFSFALYCCQVQRFDAAAAVLLQFDLYARPSEILSVHGVDIIPPVAGLTPHWGVLFGNSDFSIPTKTGTYDDVVSCLMILSTGPLRPRFFDTFPKWLSKQRT